MTLTLLSYQTFGIYLFMVQLTMLSVAPVMWHLMLVNDDLGRMWYSLYTVLALARRACRKP
jgi:hypothetical protein